MQIFVLFRKMLNEKKLIGDGVHSGLCPFENVTFGMVSIRNVVSIWGGDVHSGWCHPFGIVSSIRDGVHSECGVHLGWCRPFGMVSSIWDSVIHSGWCPFGMVCIQYGAIQGGVHSELCTGSHFLVVFLLFCLAAV